MKPSTFFLTKNPLTSVSHSSKLDLFLTFDSLVNAHYGNCEYALEPFKPSYVSKWNRLVPYIFENFCNLCFQFQVKEKWVYLTSKEHYIFGQSINLSKYKRFDTCRPQAAGLSVWNNRVLVSGRYLGGVFFVMRLIKKLHSCVFALKTQHDS